MTATILDGKALAAKIRENIGEQVAQLELKPGLGVIMVGDDPASDIYVSGKVRACEQVGIVSKKILHSKNISHMELMKSVDEMNRDRNIHGFIVQLPLPEQIDPDTVIDGILPHKDADGFTSVNMGNLLMGKEGIVSATPRGIIRLLSEYNIELEGKHAVVVGRSNIVGKPISLLLQQKNATVTMCHSRTKDLKHVMKKADILVLAIGKPKMVTKDMVKRGAVVIDVGMNRLDDGSLCGDVDFEHVKKVASHITPVPGGVGPMTIAMLLENTLECYAKADKI